MCASSTHQLHSQFCACSILKLVLLLQICLQTQMLNNSKCNILTLKHVALNNKTDQITVLFVFTNFLYLTVVKIKKQFIGQNQA